MGGDADSLSIQTSHGLRNWQVATDYGEQGATPVVVFTGPSTRLLGMTLLTRLCTTGGPVHGLRSPLLNAYEPLDVLLVGTHPLPRPIQCYHIWMGDVGWTRVIVFNTSATNYPPVNIEDSPDPVKENYLGIKIVI